jgi:hypothetical protein
MLTHKSTGLLGIGIFVALLIPSFALATADIRGVIRGTAHAGMTAVFVILTAACVAGLLSSIRSSGRT